MSKRLENQVAIVTGASRGIGRAMALGLAREGASIVVAAKSTDKAPNPKLPGTIDSVAREIEHLGSPSLAVKTDMRKLSDVENMVKQTLEHFGRVDILVNNAAVPWWQPVLATEEKHFDRVFLTQCKGPFFATRAVLSSMMANKRGSIINISPPIEPQMAKNKVAYMIAKFGLTILTHGLAEELREYNIAVASLWPVTLIESYAVIGLKMGTPQQWRKADIMADALVALVSLPPSEVTGKVWLDEEILKKVGVTDFSRYACVAGSEPLKIPW